MLAEGSVSNLVVDESRFPLVAFTFHSGATDEDVQRMLDGIDRCLRRKERFGMLIDMGSGQTTSSAQRRRIADWQSQRMDEFKQWCMCSALVTRSRLQRGLMTAYTWLVTVPYPMSAFETPEEAARWIEGHIEADRTAAGATPQT